MKKNPWEMTAEQAFQAQMEGFHSEAKGQLRLFVVRPTDTNLRAGILARDPTALALSSVINGALNDIEDHVGTDVQRACLACIKDFAGLPPGAFVVWLPEHETTVVPDHSIACPVCRTCAKRYSDTALFNKAMEYVRWFYTDAEVVRRTNFGEDD
jgi:hypothetical protein